jgi:hypothetical protein
MNETSISNLFVVPIIKNDLFGFSIECMDFYQNLMYINSFNKWNISDAIKDSFFLFSGDAFFIKKVFLFINKNFLYVFYSL